MRVWIDIAFACQIACLACLAFERINWRAFSTWGLAGSAILTLVHAAQHQWPLYGLFLFISLVYARWLGRGTPQWADQVEWL